MGPGYEPNNILNATPQDRIEPAPPALLTFETLTSEWELPLVNHNSKYPCICQSGSCANCNHCNPNNEYLKIPAAHTKYPYNSGLRFRWSKVHYNIKGNPESVASYTLYRFPSQEEATLGLESNKKIEVGSFIIPNQPYPIQSEYIEDNSIKSETKYFYRLYVKDKKGHSNKSGIFTASIRDNKPPLAPENVHTTVTGEIGKTSFIKIHWDPSKDPNNDNNLVGYKVYRRVSGAKPVKIKVYEKQLADVTTAIIYRDDDLFRLVGVVYKNPKNPNQQLEFEDQSLPQPTNPIASGIVYQYCVKAFDRSENVSYNTPSNITCQRQQKTAGPKPPTITSLQSRSNSIRLEWVAPPVPDLYTFRIFRSEKDPESASKTDWIQVSNDPKFEKVIYCNQTPPEGFPHAQGLAPADSTKPTMHEGSVANTYWFEDTVEIQPGKKYWYKIVSVDYWMNPYNKYNTNQEQAINDSSSVIMSTYTYEKFITDKPNSPTVSYNANSSATIGWSASGQGYTYILYRSPKSANDGFLPLASNLTNTSYTDTTVREGMTYWYKIQYLTNLGHYSGFSNVVELKIPGNLVTFPGNFQSPIDSLKNK
ncbi:MAG TPA: hypothetical protein VHY08_23560 [Bacillota bacterium]|nr:hypothetical protein [Bacillota bacterium]